MKRAVFRVSPLHALKSIATVQGVYRGEMERDGKPRSREMQREGKKQRDAERR
jgi:hypothetical protein